VSKALAEMLKMRFPDTTKDKAEAWEKTMSRMAVAKLTSGSKALCAASIHCKGGEGATSGTAEFLTALKDVLDQIVGHALFIVGLDSNVPGRDACRFQKLLQGMGVDFGYEHGRMHVTSDGYKHVAADGYVHVTTAKARTMFQTQVSKAGETDVSHKDYVLNWGQGQRRSTSYDPNLSTEFGIDTNGEEVRLPTTTWPFDHAAVTATFDLCEDTIRYETMCEDVPQNLNKLSEFTVGKDRPQHLNLFAELRQATSAAA
jgi:hypothetical protein